MGKYFDFSKLSEEDLKKMAANVKKDMDDNKANKKRKEFKVVDGKKKSK
jgi:hypothetical protein